MQKIKTVCPKDCYCSCSIIAHVENGKVVKTTADPESPVGYFRGICVKGANYLTGIINSKERLTSPLKRIGDDFVEISWDEAYSILYEKLKKCKDEYGSQSVAYYRGSGKFGVMSGYSLGFWSQFGDYTVTYGDLCAPAGNTAIMYTYGAIKQNKLSCLEKSKLIILWGFNPAVTNIHLMQAINKSISGGATLVTIGPMKNESCEKSSFHIFTNAGTDGLFALGLGKLLIEAGLHDLDFIENHTYGFDKFEEHLKSVNLDEVYEKTGTDKQTLAKLVDYIKHSKSCAIVCGMGIQRYSNGGQTLRAIGLIPAMLGLIGKEESGFYYQDWQAPALKWPFSPKRPKNVRKGICLPTFAKNLTELESPKIRMLWIERANPAVSNPNTLAVEKSIRQIDFVVVIDQFMTDTAMLADLVLPSTAVLEQTDIVRSYGHPYIQLEQKAIDTANGCKDEKEIYRKLGEMFDFDLSYMPTDEEEILESVIKKSGFDTSLEKMKQTPYLHNTYQEIAFSDYIFNTPSGKIEFYCAKLYEDWGVSPMPVFEPPKEEPDKYPLRFYSRHSRERINSQFNEVETLKETNPIPKIQINTSDANSRNIKNGDIVKIFNERGAIAAVADVTNSIKEGNTSMTFGWKKSDGASINTLTAERISDMGFGAGFHDCCVEITVI